MMHILKILFFFILGNVFQLGAMTSPEIKHLEKVIREKNSPEIKRLLKRDETLVNATLSPHGATPLHVAALCNHTQLGEFLIENGASTECFDERHETPLHYAVCERNSQFIQLLLNKKAFINAQDMHGNTALHKAAFANSYDIAELLLEHGATPNIRGSGDSTPLHFALHHTNLKLIEMLLANNADMYIKDSTGKTPCDIAYEKRNTQIIALFQKYAQLQEDAESEFTLINPPIDEHQKYAELLEFKFSQSYQAHTQEE